SGGNERMGCPRGTDSNPALGRLARKFAPTRWPPGLQAHPPNGARASRQRRSRGATAVIYPFPLSSRANARDLTQDQMFSMNAVPQTGSESTHSRKRLTFGGVPRRLRDSG